MKILIRISKKLMALLISISMLFSNFIPVVTIFALENTEKDDLVEIRMRGATNIVVDNGVATINYEGGNVTVSGSNLTSEQNNNWNYGEFVGTMYILYTSSNTLTFNFYPDEGRGVSYRLDGNNPERPENNTLTVNNLEVLSVKNDGYDFEFQFPGDDDRPEPTGRTFNIDFGQASWNIDGVNVTASIENKDLTNGLVEIVDSEIIKLTNYNPETMEVRVGSSDGFSTRLHVNEFMETFLANIDGDGVLPDDDLSFSIVPINNNNNNSYSVEFGDNNWNIDGNNVSASINEMVLNGGPVIIDGNTEIHLDGFDPRNMEVRINTRDGFNTNLFVDNNNNTCMTCVDEFSHVPNNETIYFNVVRLGNNGEENPEQDGNHTAIIRVNGVEGTYEERVYDPETGLEHVEERNYDGPDSIANETRFNINDGNIWRLQKEGKTFDDIGWYLYNEIEYKYDEEEGDTSIKLGLFTEWHRMFSEVITINHVEYRVSDYLDYNDRSSWLSHLKNEYIGFYIEVPKANDDIYEITVKIDNNDINYLSEFRWTNDPEEKYLRDFEGHILYEGENPIINPEYISHAKLEIVDVSFDVDNKNYYYDKFNTSSFAADFINYETGYHMEYLRGELFVPSESQVTVRITPDVGYQVTDINVPNGFIATDVPCEYKFILPNHREDLSIKVEEKNNIMDNNNENILNSDIILSSSTTFNGNYKFYTSNGNINEDLNNAFRTYADKYDINFYFSLNFSQILNKGSNDNIWDISIPSINNDATVSLKLKDNIDSDKIIIICNTKDDRFETIIPTIDKENNVVTFKTGRFTNYALASMNLEEITDINITLEAPIVGEKVDVIMEHDNDMNVDYPVATIRPKVTTSDNSNFVVDGANYVNGLCTGGNNYCNELFNGTFDINGEYFVMVYISAKDGYKLTLNSLDNITVNGRRLDISNGDEIFNIYDNGDNTMFIVKISPQKEEETIKGDFNNDGVIGLQDVIMLLKIYLGIDNSANSEIGDMNNDGEIGLADVILLLRIYLGVI